MRWGPFVLRLAVILALGVSATYAANNARELRNERSMDEMIYLPSPAFLKAASFGYEDIVADLLWLRATQYYGEWAQGEHGLGFFRNLADAVVTLDPHFEDAYRFAALVLAEEQNDPGAGIALLERGMEAMPQSWWLPFEAGFIEYVVHLDEAAAARWFRRAAEVPGAPEFPKSFAAFVTARSGDLEVSLVLWRTVAETATSAALREKALDYVQQLEAALSGEAPVPEWVHRRRIINGRSSGGA